MTVQVSRVVSEQSEGKDAEEFSDPRTGQATRKTLRAEREREGLRRIYQETLATIKVLLSDHAIVYQGGDSFINMEELGATEPGLPLNAARIRRYFQDRPEEMAVVGRYFLDSVEAESHLLIEAKLAEWRRFHPHLTGPIDAIHLRSNSGHADADYQLKLWAAQAQRNTLQHTRSQRQRAREAQDSIYFYHMGLNQLAWWFTVEGIELFSTRAHRKAIRDAETNDQKHDEYYARYKDLLAEGKSAERIYETLMEETELSRSYLEKIISARRALSGEAPRKPGRPRKTGKPPLALHKGKVWSRLSKDHKSYEIGCENEIIAVVPLKNLPGKGEGEEALEEMHHKIAQVANTLRVRRFTQALQERM